VIDSHEKNNEEEIGLNGMFLFSRSGVLGSGMEEIL